MFSFQTAARAAFLLIATPIALLVVSSSASAITQQQWTAVCTEFVGLRSGSTRTDSDGAGYAMDNGNAVPLQCLRPPPDGWDTMLGATIDMIKGFQNSGDRYLLMVKKCTGTSRDYPNTFPKCSRINSPEVLHATPQQLSHYTAAQLVDWVNANLP